MADKRTTPEIRFKGFETEWEERSLGDIGEEYYGGGTPETAAPDYWNGNIPWIQSSDIPEEKLSNIEPRKKITEQGIKSSATKLVPENSIAIVTRVGVGKLAYMPYEYATSQDFLSLSKLKVDSWFAIYSIWKKIQSELHSVQGTSIKGITKNELLCKPLMVALTEKEQSQIGTFFKNIDSLITLNQRKHDKLTTVKKAMLEKMFPKEGTDVPEVRFEGFTEKWEKLTLGEIATACAEQVPTPKDGYWRLGIRSHAKGTFHSFVQPGRELEAAKMYKVSANNLIVNITFAWEHAVAITDGNDDGKLVSHRFPQFSFNEGMVPEYFKYLIIDKRFKYHLWLSSPGGAGRNRVLKINEMLEYPFWVPKEAEQIKIANFFQNLDSLINLQQHELDKLKNIKKACLEKMFV